MPKDVKKEEVAGVDPDQYHKEKEEMEETLEAHRAHLARWIESIGDPGSERPEVYELETQDQMKVTRNRASREQYRRNAELYKQWAREGK